MIKIPESFRASWPLLGLMMLAVAFSACDLEKPVSEGQVATFEPAPEEPSPPVEPVVVLEPEEDAAELAAAREQEQEAERERLAAAERELARREAEQAERERRFREAEAERARVAARQAELEARERELAEREREVAERELAAAMRQQQAAEVEPVPEPVSPAVEPVSTPTPELTPEPTPRETPPTADVSLQPGTLLQIEFVETVSSATHRAGDAFAGRVAKDVYSEDGALAVPAGSEVRGRVLAAQPLRRVGGQASLEVEFYELVVPSGQTVGLNASFVEQGTDKRRDKRKIIGAAVAGAILGRVLGGKGTGEVLAGAAVGAAAGTAVVARNEGREAELQEGERIGLVLEEVVTVTAEMTGLVNEG